jgi:hypothetical protein
MPLTTPSVIIDMFDMSGGWVPDASQFSLSPNELLLAENVELDYRGGFRVRAGYANVANTGVAFAHLAAYTEGDGDHHLVGVTTAGDIYSGTALAMSDSTKNLAAYTIGTDPDREYDVSFAQLRDYLYVSSLRGNTWRFDGTTWLEITDSTLNGGGVDGTPEFPKAKSVLALHNRVFAANIIDAGTSYHSRIAWSTLTAGADQYGGNRFEATSFIDVQEDDGGQIQAIHPFQSNIIIFKDDAIYVLAGDDTESFSVFPSDETVGTTVSGSIASDESVLFFLDPRSGVYGFDGVKAQRIDEQVNSEIMGIIAGFGQDKLFAKGWIEDSKYFLCIGQMDGNKQTFVFDMRYQAWVHWDMTWTDLVSYKDVTYHAGSDGTSTFRNRTYLDDDGTDVDWEVKTAWIPPAPEQDMRQYRLRRFDLSSQWVTGGAATYEFDVFADNDDTTPIYTSDPAGDEATERMPGYDGLVFRFMMRYRGTNTSAVSTDRRITGTSIKMSARPSKGSFGAGLTGPTSAITETRNLPGLYWRLIDERYASNGLNTVPRPDGGENGDHLIAVVSRDSAFELVADLLGAGWQRDEHEEESLGDSLGLGVYSKKVTDWSTEPTTITASDDGWGRMDHMTVFLIRGLAASSWKVASDFTNWQGVSGDFLMEDVASAYKNMVLRVWFFSADVGGTNGRAALALESNGYEAVLPQDTSTMSSEIYLHDARASSATTGTFNIDFVGGGGPEAMTITVVYLQA